MTITVTEETLSRVENLNAEGITLYVGDVADIELRAFVKGAATEEREISVDDLELSYELIGDNIATVADKKITATAVGNASLAVTATLGGMNPITSYIPVSVIEDGYAYLELNAVTQVIKYGGEGTDNEFTKENVVNFMNDFATTAFFSAMGMAWGNPEEVYTILAESKETLTAEQLATIGDASYIFTVKKSYPAGVSYDTVGLYKVDDYTIRYVLKTYQDVNYFLTSLTSTWLVHTELYDAGKDYTGELVTTTYGTSKETTASYGTYKIEIEQIGTIKKINEKIGVAYGTAADYEM